MQDKSELSTIHWKFTMQFMYNVPVASFLTRTQIIVDRYQVILLRVPKLIEYVCNGLKCIEKVLPSR